MFKLSPSIIQYLPGLEYQEEKDISDEENVEMLVDILHADEKNKPVLQVCFYAFWSDFS